jgi:hypothetical protein
MGSWLTTNLQLHRDSDALDWDRKAAGAQAGGLFSCAGRRGRAMSWAAINDAPLRRGGDPEKRGSLTAWDGRSTCFNHAQRGRISPSQHAAI